MSWLENKRLRIFIYQWLIPDGISFLICQPFYGSKPLGIYCAFPLTTTRANSRGRGKRVSRKRIQRRRHAGLSRKAQIFRAALYTYFGSKQKAFSGVIEFFLTVIIQSSIDALERVGDNASVQGKLFAVFDLRQLIREVVNQA